MERLTIDEIIQHCENKTFLYETVGRNIDFETTELTDAIKEYWEHKQVKEYLEELKRYRDLEEQGLLLRLPVPIGTTVYKFEPLAKGTERYIKTTITRYEVFDDSIWFTFANGLGRNIEDFGKYVFLTQEEAEQRLKEMEDK